MKTILEAIDNFSLNYPISYTGVVLVLGIVIGLCL